MIVQSAWRRTGVGLVCLCLLFLARPAAAQDKSIGTYRWGGKSFVFCLITDDGTKCNLGWAQAAMGKGFRYSIAINSGKVASHLLSREDVNWLQSEGFEITNHTYSHCMENLPDTCPRPPRGSMLGYFLCDGIDDTAAMLQFGLEIDRQVLADYACCSKSAIRTVAYPRHMYSHAVIDSLIAQGYHGARFGDSGSYSYFSCGEYDTPPRNSWEGGISLFRVPVMHYAPEFFGNHSADPPVHYTYEEFREATLPYIEQARRDGGIFALYAHHFGDDCDDMGDINYGSSGMTVEDMEWMVDLVREYGGRVMTFGDAVDYYRSRSVQVEMDGDYVWVATAPTDAPSAPEREPELLCTPNPFNPTTVLEYRLERDCECTLTISDPRGRRVAELAAGPHVSGWHSATWAGRDDQGTAVSSGVYFVTLRAEDHVVSKQVTLLK